MSHRAAVVASALMLSACSRAPERAGPPTTADEPPPGAVSVPPAPSEAPHTPPSVADVPVAPCEDLGRPGPRPASLDLLPRAERLRGVDVSSLAPWKTLRDAGVAFAFSAATYGLTKNTAFPANWAMMKRCRLPRGAYHRLTEKGDGAAQARAFLEQIEGDPGELPPVVDVEKPSCVGACCGLSCAAWIRIATAFVETVTAKASRKPIVYLVEPFLNDCLCGTRALASLPLWLAGEGRADVPEKIRAGGFGRWTFYQHATNVRVGGAAVDLDLFRGTARDLERFMVTGALPE